MSSPQWGSWNVEVPASRRNENDRKSWGADVNRAKEPQRNNSHRLSPKTPQGASRKGQRGNRRQHDSPAAMSDQLSNIKKQWDVQRDIPSGTVKNNPFVPKVDPALAPAPSPQLMHQKRQWDTSGIQRGSVAARTMSMEGEMADDFPLSSPSRISPQLQKNRQRFDGGYGLVSPSGPLPPTSYNKQSQSNRRSFPFDNTTPSNLNKAQTAPLQGPNTRKTAGSSAGTTSLRGRLIENPLLSAPPVQSSPKWEPQKEIPVGTVKGKVNQLFTPNAEQPTPHKRGPEPEGKHTFLVPAHDGPAYESPEFEDDPSADDPWIIPSKNTGPRHVSSGNWGEALAVKSSGSDDWDSSAADWFKSSESQTTMSEYAQNARHAHRHRDNRVLKETQTKDHPRNLHLGILEEKKLNEEDSAEERHQMLRLSRQKDPAYPANDDPFGTTHARDAEILLAAKEKSRKTSITKTANQNTQNIDILDVFLVDTSADNQGFPAEPFTGEVFVTSNKSDDNLEFAFPASPFGANSAFDDFSVAGKDRTAENMAPVSGLKEIPAPAEEFFPSLSHHDEPCNDPAHHTLSHHDEPCNDPAHHTPFEPQQKNDTPESSNDCDTEVPHPSKIDCPPRKEKKGFFTKLFGGGRKSKSSTPTYKNDRKSEVGANPKNFEKEESGKYQASYLQSVVAAEPIPRASLSSPRQPHAFSEAKLQRGKSEDETTVSEMTLPTVFKDPLKAAQERARLVSHGLVEILPSQEPVLVANAQGHGDPGFSIISDHSKSDEDETAPCPQPTTRENEEGSNPIESRPEERSAPALFTQLNSQVEQQPPPPPPPPRKLDEDHSPNFDGILDQEDFTEASNCVHKTPASTPATDGASRVQVSLADSARFNRKVKDLKNSTVRHRAPSVTLVTRKPALALSSAEKKGKQVPSFVARHARAKNAKTQSKSDPAVVSAEHIASTGSIGKREQKFQKASKAFQQVKKPYRGPQIMSNAVPVKLDSGKFKSGGSFSSPGLPCIGSTHSQGTVESSSVGSDIRVLRNILRRPRNEMAAVAATRPKPTFVSYDESSITDPMQRAGLRLLSAAIIPIQTEVRRFLAMRRALTRMWALIVIQSVTRRWIARKQFLNDMRSIVVIQAVCRGHQQRSHLVLRHICAIEIQRFVRGYLSTMRVYEDIYKITMIQSYVRMKLAMEEATNRMALVIQLQSVARGFLVRRRLEYQEACAVAIQANWRCFFARLTYQFDLLDVIITQSVWRRKMAMQEAKARRNVIQSRCAVVIQTNWRSYDCRRNYLRYRSARIIQTKWRSYDCTMNYLHYLADVLIVQSTVRRFLVLKRLERRRHDAAIKIQSVWRSFVCYADYMFSIADIVVVQKIARRWIACRRTSKLRSRKHSQAVSVIQRSWRNFLYARRIQRVWRLRAFNRKREQAALTIQKCWRCFVDETEFVVMKYEYYAARTIQSYWRRFWCFSNFIIALDCSIQIQSAYRGYHQRQELRTMNKAATLIQCAARMFLAKKEKTSILFLEQVGVAAEDHSTLEKSAAVLIQCHFRAMQARIAVKVYCAARRIQSFVRGLQARTAIRLYVCARTIQATWRSKRIRKAYVYYCSARRIQSFWRCKRMHAAYKFYRAALLIQTRFRVMKARRDVLVLRGEFLAATLIQSAWRGFVCYTDYIFTVSDIISAQKTARRYLARKQYGWQIKEQVLLRAKQNTAIVSIQKVCRGFNARQKYWYALGCTMQIQSWMRGRLIVLRLRREAWARLKLQCFARRCLGRQEYLQRKFILVLLRTADQERTKRVAAMVIQDRCRGYLEDKKRDDAARVIQRFFLMVKREVDQMIKATKSRKTWRKKTKRRDDKVEDALLEDAWASAVSYSNLSVKPPLLTVSSSQDSGPNENIRANARRNVENESSGSGSQSKGYLRNRDPFADPRQKLPPRHSDRPSSVVRLHNDDERSEFSGLTSSTANFARPPVTRMKRLGSREMDEDLELEEAFIDAEIFSAKERRMFQIHGQQNTGLLR